MVIILLILLSLPAVSALFPAGYFYTHDGIFHIVRLMHFSNELSRGQFPVRWAQDLAFGYGYPVFNYFYPLMYYWGALFHSLGASFGDSIKLVLFLSTIGSGLFFYKWLRCYFGKLPALVGAVFFIYTPFRFLATYVNGQFGAIVALLFVPIIFWSCYQFLASKKLFYLPIFSVALAGLLLSHNITSLIFLPVLVGYVVINLFEKKEFLKEKILWLVGATILSIGLAAFFLIPALGEFQYIQSSIQSAVNYEEHWPTLKQLIYSKWGYGFSGVGDDDGQSFQLGVAQWLVVGLSLLIILFIVIKRKKSLKTNLTPLYFFVCFILSIFFMLSISDIFWKNIKIIQEIQFPWRILVLSMFTSAYLAAWVVARFPKLPFAILLIVFVIVANRNNLRTWHPERYPDKFYRESLEYDASTDIAWELRPIWAKDHPNWSAGEIIPITPGIKIDGVTARSKEDFEFNTESTKSAELSINLFYFPKWQMFVDSKIYSPKPDKLGLLSLTVPAGKHHILVKLGDTLIESISNIISLISLLILVISIIFLRIKRRAAMIR